ncbi:unnamed protein product [Knipowitschia caucasica]|uniref:LITAF domain-containing protein n=1 Tax=Knipowitschia caucasica TaxID=637954 RepID=A0AAV2LKW0_KNICA
MEGPVEELVPTPPSYIQPGTNELDVRFYSIQMPFSPMPPPSFSFSPAVAVRTPAKHVFISYESILGRSPGLTTCPSCQVRVTTEVTYRAGILAWGLCVTCIILGLVLGCCVIPLVINYFKDSYHTCPRCRRVLHVHRRGCCD